MNKSLLKKFAINARKQLLEQVANRAGIFGITKDKIQPVQVHGETLVINGVTYDNATKQQYEALVKRLGEIGFEQLIEEVAYTWFNRFIAIRFMELNEYLPTGVRVFSSVTPNKPEPDLLTNALKVDLPLDKEKIYKFQDNNDQEGLFKYLFIVECNELSKILPFLFEKINNYTELLLPDRLLFTSSIINKMLTETDEADWKEVEIVGWLYQYYIAEKKDEVFAALKNNVKITAQNIPAATQLFTPHWIVRYMVENSLGRLWMLNNPNSKLKQKMDFYIEPTEIETDYLHIKSPEELKICDPACGSGHILVYAFDLLYSIYEEAGYNPLDIAGLIIKNNLYGIEIDKRAGSLAAFALFLKAAGKQKRFLKNPVQPNICVLENVVFEEGELADYIKAVGRNLFTNDLNTLLSQFSIADHVGSLIQPIKVDIQTIRNELEHKDLGSNMFLSYTHGKVLKLLDQAEYLGQRYHVTVANPPYMGGKGMSDVLRSYAEGNYPHSKADLCTMFMDRSLKMALPFGYMAMINLPSWLFLSTFEKLRENIITNYYIQSLLHMGRGIFGIDWGSTTFVIQNQNKQKIGAYFRLHKRNFQHILFDDIKKLFINANKDHSYKYNFDEYRDEEGTNEIPLKSNQDGSQIYYSIQQLELRKIPSSPIAYWVSKNQLRLLKEDKLEKTVVFKEGLTTANNDLFLRFWSEIYYSDICFHNDISNKNAFWVPYNKGGPFRKWYGNQEYVVDWRINGSKIKEYPGSSFRNERFQFNKGATFSAISAGGLSARYSGEGFAFDSKGPMFFSEQDLESTIIYLNSNICKSLLLLVAPTLDFRFGTIQKLPLLKISTKNIDFLIDTTKKDWNSYETAWDFAKSPVLVIPTNKTLLQTAYIEIRQHWSDMTLKMQKLEIENNSSFIDVYGLQDELTPNVPIEEITLTCNPYYRYGKKCLNQELGVFPIELDLEARLLEDTIKEFLSYSVGCMMGRYSLDIEGLAFAGGEFDASKYSTFPADDDAIIPVLDNDYFEDDIVSRFVRFLEVTFGKDNLSQNLEFIAKALGKTPNESALERIRKYFLGDFYKDHLQTYKNRPIYWMFSSGKEKAFNALVYLHRYSKDTLSQMRTDYLHELQGKLELELKRLDQSMENELSSTDKRTVEKRKEKILKQQAELKDFDAELQHLADQQIELDLDDGVKVNYAKFGDLVVKAKM